MTFTTDVKTVELERRLQELEVWKAEAMAAIHAILERLDEPAIAPASMSDALRRKDRGL